MKKVFIFINLCFLIFSFSKLNAQTFTAAASPYNIPTNVSTCIPITVSGIGTIDATLGLESVCLNLTIANVMYAHISLQAPDGTEYYLVYETSSGANYTNTCFNSNATTPIWLGSSPYTGDFMPETNLGGFNNGMNANGTWYICFDNGGSLGTLNSASIEFSNTPANACGAIADDNCGGSAPLICDFNGYCGTTSNFYTVPAGEDDAISGCGYALNNNSWVKFVPYATEVSIDVVVDDCENGSNWGVQFGVWESSDCATFTNISCATNPLIGSHSITFSSLSPGTTYYLMIDGYAGDVCNYSFTVSSGSGVAVVEIDQGDSMEICNGDDVNLSVPTLPGVTYTWSGDASGTGATTTINNATPPLNVTVTSAGQCNAYSDSIIITADPNCCYVNAGSID